MGTGRLWHWDSINHLLVGLPLATEAQWPFFTFLELWLPLTLSKSKRETTLRDVNILSQKEEAFWCEVNIESDASHSCCHVFCSSWLRRLVPKWNVLSYFHLWNAHFNNQSYILDSVWCHFHQFLQFVLHVVTRAGYGYFRPGKNSAQSAKRCIKLTWCFIQGASAVDEVVEKQFHWLWQIGMCECMECVFKSQVTFQNLE